MRDRDMSGQDRDEAAGRSHDDPTFMERSARPPARKPPTLGQRPPDNIAVTDLVPKVSCARQRSIVTRVLTRFP
jgi:hypothetical protein